MELKIFGRTHFYEFDTEVERDIRVLSELVDVIKEPQELIYDGGDVIQLTTRENDEKYIGSDCIKWLYEQKKAETGTDGDIRACLLKCATEDKEWTANANKKFGDIRFRRITFLPDVQNLLIGEFIRYINEAKEIRDAMRKEAEDKETSRNARQKEWKEVKVYSSRKASGRESGADGYKDADYIDQAGNTIRMVSRDVFDFGKYHYPKRLEGTEDVFNRSEFTSAERNLVCWLTEFGTI